MLQKEKSINLNQCGGFYMHESSQNEHIKENQLFCWFQKKHEHKDRLPFSETTITWELKLDWGFRDQVKIMKKKKKRAK